MKLGVRMFDNNSFCVRCEVWIKNYEGVRCPYCRQKIRKKPRQGRNQDPKRI